MKKNFSLKQFKNMYLNKPLKAKYMLFILRYKMFTKQLNIRKQLTMKYNRDESLIKQIKHTILSDITNLRKNTGI